MLDIVTPSEFASHLRVDLALILDRLDLLELAQGLVVEEVGELDPWPATARAVTLAAASRAYLNPQGLKSETTGPFTAVRDSAAMGVYLTDDERARLHRAPGVASPGGPIGAFPSATCWPDAALG